MSTEELIPTDLNKKIGNLLVEGVFVTSEDLRKAFVEAGEKGKSLRQVLDEKRIVASETYALFISMELRVPVVDLRQAHITNEILNLIPEESARKYRAIPLMIEENALRVAMENPRDEEAIAALSLLTGRKIRPRLPLGDILPYLEDYNNLWKKEPPASPISTILTLDSLEPKVSKRQFIDSEEMDVLEKAYKLSPKKAVGSRAYRKVTKELFDNYIERLIVLLRKYPLFQDVDFVRGQIESAAEHSEGVKREILTTVGDRFKKSTRSEQIMRYIEDGIRNYRPKS